MGKEIFHKSEAESSSKSNQWWGQLAALGMGLGIGSINKVYGHDLWPSTIAGLKQWGYSATAAGLFISLQNKLYDQLKGREVEGIRFDLLSILIPATGTIIATYILHSIKGTPEPIASTVPTVIFAPVGYTIFHIRKLLQELDGIQIKIDEKDLRL